MLLDTAFGFAVALAIAARESPGVGVSHGSVDDTVTGGAGGGRFGKLTFGVCGNKITGSVDESVSGRSVGDVIITGSGERRSTVSGSASKTVTVGKSRFIG